MDEKRQKATYPALLGLDAAKEWARHLVAAAVAELEPLGEKATPLAEIARYLLVRRS
jgi:geranylgeranyl pyrophosphate synthase